MLTCREDKFVKTTEDWHSNFPENRIKITLDLCEMRDEYYNAHLRAWVNDDFALALDKNGIKNFQEAFVIYKELEKIYDAIPEIVTKDWFYKHGFEQF